MQFEAAYYDGISSRAKLVTVEVVDGRLVGRDAVRDVGRIDHVQNDVESYFNNVPEAAMFDYAATDCHVQVKLGSGKRLIDLPDGGHLETDVQDLSQLQTNYAGNGFWRALHFAETHLSVVVLALVCTVLVSLAMLKYGVPVAAKYAAQATPANIEKDLGKQTLDALDHAKFGYFEASKLTTERQEQIQNALTAMCKKTQTCPVYDLKFRSSAALGANALALPGSFVVITDGLVNLADNDDEITAVLAHELGHVKLRHALRQTLQGTISGLIIVALTGDISSIAAGLPTLMVNMSYTRELEMEADTYAFESLKAACIPAKSFSAILSKLAHSHEGAVSLPEIISSHPDTKSRIDPFDKDQQNCT